MTTASRTAASGTAPPDSTLAGRLEPVRRAVLADAAAEAEQLLGEARREAGQRIAEAERECDSEVAEVERRNELAAQANADRLLARARADAHADILHARARAYDDLVEAVHVAVADLRHDSRYPALLDHFAALARAQLGEDAQIERDPQPDGGITAVAGGRRVDYSLPELADRAIDALADEVAQLWT